MTIRILQIADVTDFIQSLLRLASTPPIPLHRVSLSSECDYVGRRDKKSAIGSGTTNLTTANQHTSRFNFPLPVVLWPGANQSSLPGLGH
jgi:hypothetical protein